MQPIRIVNQNKKGCRMENKIAIVTGVIGAVAAALFDLVGVAFTMLLFLR